VKIFSEFTLKGSPYSITERRVPELIQVLDSQPAGDVSHKPGGRLPLLSARPALPPQPQRGLLPILLLGEQRHNGCEQTAEDCDPTASRLRFEPGPSAPESSTPTTRLPSHPLSSLVGVQAGWTDVAVAGEVARRPSGAAVVVADTGRLHEQLVEAPVRHLHADDRRHGVLVVHRDHDGTTGRHHRRQQVRTTFYTQHIRHRRALGQNVLRGCFNQSTLFQTNKQLNAAVTELNKATLSKWAPRQTFCTNRRPENRLIQ